MLSQSLDDFYRDSSLDLKGFSLRNVREITIEGQSTDGITARLMCNPTEERTVTVPDRTFTINSASDLSGTTLPDSIVNSNIQTLGAQTETLDMNGNSIINAFVVSASDSVRSTFIVTPSVINPTEHEPVLVGEASSFGYNSSKIHELKFEASSIIKQSTTPLTISAVDPAGSNETISLIGDVYCNGYDMSGVNDLTCTNLTVTGLTTTIETEQVNIKDNMIQLNSNQTGDPLETLVSGIQVKRGDKTDYQFMYQESSNRFVVGKIGELQQVATRQDTPTPSGIAYWNSTLNRFDTDSTLTSSNVVTSTGLSTTLSGLTTSNIPEPTSNVTNRYFTDQRAQSALAGMYEVPITMGTGLSRDSNTINVNTTQSISQLSNLNGTGPAFVKVDGSGNLSRDNATYQTPLSFGGGLTNSSGSVSVDTTQSINRLSSLTGTGPAFVKADGSGNLSRDNATYQTPLTFSGGLTNSSGTVTADTTQNISRLSNITTAGFVKSSVTGTLSVDTAIYDVVTSAGTGLTRSNNSYSVNQSQNITTLSNLTGTGSALVSVNGSGVLSRDSTAYLSSLSGDVSNSGSTVTIAANAVTLSKMASMTANSILGNNTGSSRVPLALNASEVRSLLSLSTTSDVAFNSVTASLVGNASSASTVSTTNLGRTGDIPMATVNTQSGFANLPIGYSNYMAAVATAGVMPNTFGNFYLNKMGNRNTLGGSWFLAYDWSTGPLWVGRAVDNTVFPTWQEIVDTSSSQTLQNKSIAASQLTGTISAARLPALTGDVTMSSGTTLTSIANLALTKLAPIGVGTLLGNNTASSSSPIAISAADVKTMLSLAASDVGLGSTSTPTFGTLTLAGTTGNGSLTMSGNSFIQTSTTAGHRINFRGYNTTTSSYIEMFRITSGSSPVLDFNSSATITLGGSPLTTAANTQSLTNKTLDSTNSIDAGAIKSGSLDAARFSATSVGTLGNLTLAGTDSLGGTLTMPQVSYIRTGTEATGRVIFQAYNTGSSSYTELFRLISGATPTLDFNGLVNITYGVSQLTTAANTQTLSNKTLAAATNSIDAGAIKSGTLDNARLPTTITATLSGNASSASTVGTTNLGRTGNLPLVTVGNQAAFSNLPIGYSIMHTSTSTGATGGMPPANGIFYFNKMGNRDTAGGWWGLATDYASGPMYYGRAGDSASYAGWTELCDTTNTQVLNNKSLTSLKVGCRVVTSSTTVQGSDTVLLVVAVSGANSISVTLPPSDGTSGRIITVKSIGNATANAVGIVPGTGNFIDDTTIPVAVGSWQSASLVQNANKWYVI